MSHFDHRTNQCELEVQRIIHLQNLANQLLESDTKIVTKHISRLQMLKHGLMSLKDNMPEAWEAYWLKRLNSLENENTKKNWYP